MDTFRQKTLNEAGVVLISTLLVLSLLTIIGISATSTSSVEQQISANDRNYNVALYHTDSGAVTVTKMVNQVLFDRDLTVTSEVTLLQDLDDIVEQIKYSDKYDNRTWDMEYTIGGTAVKLDIHPWATKAEEGGASLEFITGNQSTAAGGGGGGVKYFRIEAQGESSQGVTPNISVNYRRPGINNAGGY